MRLEIKSGYDLFLSRHPRSCLPGTKACRKAQTSCTHGEVADKIPNKTSELSNGRQERKDCAMQLDENQ